MNPITRRQALWLALAASSATGLSACGAQADDDNAVFWRLGKDGPSQSTLFGYDRIAASLVLDIVQEGSKKVEAAKRLVQDFPASVTLPAIKLDESQAAPVMGRLDAKTADALRSVVRSSFPQLADRLDRMMGIEISMLLMAEGQTPAKPTVGGTIFQHGLEHGLQSTTLVGVDELRALFVPPDFAKMDNAVGQDTVSYMLALRQQQGPIGRHFEKLYAARKGGEIHGLGAELEKRGVFIPSQLFQGDKIKGLLIDRVEAAVTGNNVLSAFILLPLDTLTGGDGAVAALRKRGNVVTATA